MTILVALVCEGAAALASDSRSIDSQTKEVRNDCTKTFAYVADGRQALGGIAGQMMDGDSRMTDVVTGLCAGAATLDDLAQTCSRELRPRVPLRNGVTVVLIASANLSAKGTPEIRVVRFDENVEQPTVTKREHRANEGTCAHGTPGAAAVARQDEKGWSPATVTQVARESVLAAVAASEAAEGGAKDCGGEAVVVDLTFDPA